MAWPPEAAQQLEQNLTGKRIALDVSVLLAGLLDRDSPSHRILGASRFATIVISDHVEDMARRVLSYHAPDYLTVFNDELLRLGTRSRIERVAVAPGADLPDWTSALSDEDRQVVIGAVRGSADTLLTHDSEIFRGRIPGLQVQSPAATAIESILWMELPPISEEFTFLAWFVPMWDSASIAMSELQFFVFEIERYMQCFYDASSQQFRIRWHTLSPCTGGVGMKLAVESQSFNFIAVVCSQQRVTLFVNGRTKIEQARLGPPPQGTKLHLFSSASLDSQLSAAGDFFLANRAYREREVRRHWLAHSVRLTDGELKFAEWAAGPSLIIRRGRDR